MLVGMTGATVFFYIHLTGPEVFYLESVGTLILSPLIYFRFLPAPMDVFYMRALGNSLLLQNLLCILPLAVIGISSLAGLISLKNRSLGLALVCMFGVGSVFSLYHFLQPYGFTAIR